MLSFSIVTPGPDNWSCKASLLTFDNETKVLIDPSWNGENHEDILYLEPYLKEVDLILLSHPTPEFISGYVLLCVKFPTLMSNIPTYSTLPVNQLGRVSTVEYYRSCGILGPLKDSILEVEEVDEYFDRVMPLKYFQTTELFQKRLVITPYNAGHSLGGAFWLIVKRMEKVIYAPSWNHSKDSFLNNASFFSSSTGNPLSQLTRPTAVITNTDLGSPMSHKKRTEKFLQLVDATLANGGALVLPTSLSGRFLELLHLVDKHLQSAPIPVYCLSYSGTKVLSYASNLLEWMSSLLVKEWEEASSATNNSSNKNNFPFDPSKVDLLLEPSELVQLSGPKVVFCSGVEFNQGEFSSEALQYLCQDEKTTIILTEKTHFGSDCTINAQLFNEWYNLATSKLGGAVEDGIAVPLEKTLSLDGWKREEPLIGSELTDFQERIQEERKRKLLAKVRDRKNQNLLNAEFNLDDTSSDEEVSSDEENDMKQSESVMPSELKSVMKSDNQDVNGLGMPETFVSDHVKKTLEESRPLDLQITHKMKPRQAMFPYYVDTKAHRYDDYGELININDFQKQDSSMQDQLMESKRKFENNGKGKWSNADNKGKGHGKEGDSANQNKVTPQEALNNELLQKNLDTLYNPKKRVPLNAASSLESQSVQLKIRCGLSFVDLSGVVDLRSLSMIMSSLKPYNVLLMPDFSYSRGFDERLDGLRYVKHQIDEQQEQQLNEGSKHTILNTSRFLPSAVLKARQIEDFSSHHNASNKHIAIPVELNKEVKIGSDSDDMGLGIGASNFEIKLDDEIVDNLAWQKVDGNYSVAQVYGELEILNQEIPRKKQKTLSDYLNSSTQFTLRSMSEKDFLKQQLALLDTNSANSHTFTNSGSKLTIGNVRLTELKKRLLSRNLNAEFKSEGTLVVNNCVAVRKILFSSAEGEDSGDIVIEGSLSTVYYEVKNCIRDMLAYI